MVEAREIVNTTKEAVLEAASSCPDVKTALKILFPDVFKPEVGESGFVPGQILKSGAGINVTFIGMASDDRALDFYKSLGGGVSPDYDKNQLVLTFHRDSDGETYLGFSQLSTHWYKAIE